MEALRDRKLKVILAVPSVYYKAYKWRQKLPPQKFEIIENSGATTTLLDNPHYGCTHIVISSVVYIYLLQDLRFSQL